MIVQSSGKNILGQMTVLRRRMIQDLREEARDLRLFAKEFGLGVRQQRVRDKKKEKAGTLPLVLRMTRRVRKWKRCWHARKAASLKRRATWNSSNWNSSGSLCRGRCSYLKTQLETRVTLGTFFLAIPREDFRRSNDGIFERTMRINWLEPSEEDPLLYIL